MSTRMVVVLMILMGVALAAAAIIGNGNVFANLRSEPMPAGCYLERSMVSGGVEAIYYPTARVHTVPSLGRC